MRLFDILKRFKTAFAILAMMVVAAEAKPEASQVYKAIVEDIVQSGFQATARAANAHAKDWALLCGAEGANTFGKTRGSFHALADAWARVEMFHSGPASKDFRRDRFYLWPERKNAVARALNDALQTPADTLMDEAWMQQQSAAIQGLPVLERLLFGEGDQTEAPAAGTMACNLGVAASRNVAQLAGNMATDWNNMSDSVANRTALATELVSGIAFAKQVKLENVIGKTEIKAKPKAAEFWRSNRSLRNIVINLETYRDAATIINAALDETATISFAANSAHQIATDMKDPLVDYIKPPQRSEAYLLDAALDSLAEIASTEVSAALGVTIGFNSADGD
jgi:uncharacterized protein